MNILTIRALRAALVCALCFTHGVASAHSAEVRIAITVSTEDGKPLPGLLLRALVDGRQRGVTDGVTDANGKLILAVDVPFEASFVDIRRGFSSPSTIPDREQLGISKVSTQLGLDYHFDTSYRVPFVPSQADYELKVTAWTAITVTGAFVDQRGHPLGSVSLYGPPNTWVGVWSSRGSQPLRALRKGAAADLAALAQVGPSLVVKPIHLDAHRTGADVDLGRIVIEEPPTGTEIRTRLVGDDALMALGIRLSAIPGMTAVSRDGKLIATFRAAPADADLPVDAPLNLATSERWKPTLPPGEYFIVPRFFMYDEPQAILIELLSKGIDLGKSDIPRITVRDGAPNDDTVDLVKSYEALRRLAVREGIRAADKSAPK